MQDGERQRRQKDLDDLTARFEQKTGERERVLGLFRRGRIDDRTLDQPLDLINSEAIAFHAGIEAATRARSAGDGRRLRPNIQQTSPKTRRNVGPRGACTRADKKGFQRAVCRPTTILPRNVSTTGS